MISLRHEFVTAIPEHLGQGVVYISIPYATVTHLCACGCSQEVSTPLTPTDWSLIYDGETISLHPSIGNWSLLCRSHYWIKRNQVIWAKPWSQERVEKARQADRKRKNKFFQLNNRKRTG